jgi:hypothetical protein
MLRGFLAGVADHLEANGEAWLIMSILPNIWAYVPRLNCGTG